MTVLTVVHVADDDAAVRQALAGLFESLGYLTCTHATGGALLTAVSDDQVGCVVLDERLPDMDGLAVLGALQQRHSLLSIIMLTGYGKVSSAVQAIQLGAVNYFEKPTSDQVLETAVREAVELSRQRQAARAQRQRLDALLSRLTARERQVAELIAQGLTSRVISHRLGLSDKTVAVHRAQIMRKLEVSGVASLVRLLVAPTPPRLPAAQLGRMLVTA